MAEPLSSNKPRPQIADSDAPPLTRGASDPTLPVPPGTEPSAKAAASLSAGMHLGPYELIEMLGQGGMGTVWKARHKKLDKLVAVKLLPTHLVSDADSVSRFEREMKAVGRLEHQHIVRAMDAGQADGIHYLVMEYIEGTDLSRHVKKRGTCTVTEACELVRQTALGLAHAHEHGLVHRDIKPSNLLLTKEGDVKILDLGLARLQCERAAGEVSLTAYGATMGTPDYMAPEQWQSAHTVGPEADLYALGCTLFDLLIGHPPFGRDERSSYGQKMKAHLFDLPPRLRSLRPDVPTEVEALCESLLEKEPAQRPSSAKQVAGDLKAMLENWAKRSTVDKPAEAPQPVPVQENSKVEMVSAVQSKARTSTRYVVVAAALALVAVGLAWRYGTSSQLRRQEVSSTSSAVPSTTPADVISIGQTAKDLYALGRDLCFVHDDWNKGIPLLAKGHNSAIREAALKELTGAETAEAQAEIGTLWHSAAATASEPDNWHCYRRARHWLTKALAAGSSQADSSWHHATQKQMDILPTLKTTLRLKAHSFHIEVITIGRNHIEWISHDGAGPQEIINDKTGKAMPSFRSKYGTRTRHSFDADQVRIVLPEAVDFTTASLRVVSKSGPTSSVATAAIIPEGSDDTKVTIRLAEWDRAKKKVGNYKGDFHFDVALSFGF